MTVQFTGIPSNLRAPANLAEFDPSRASPGAASLAYNALIIGQKLNGVGSASANTIHRVRNADEVATLAGRGSMLHRMAIAFFYSNKSTVCYVGVLADSGSARASGTFNLTGAPTAAGAISFYIGGNLVRIAVASGASIATILAALAAEIGTRATGTVTMATPIATNTVTIGGVLFTGTAGAVTPGAATFSVDTGNTEAAASLAAQVNAHAVASTKVHATSALAVVRFFAADPSPTVGNAVTLTSSGSTVAVSGATLSGGATGTNPDLPAFAFYSGSGGDLSIIATNSGAAANEIDLRVNFRADSEATPTGLTVAITDMANGAVNPTLTTLIAALGDTWFNVVANPYTDATSLSALEAEALARFAPLRHVDMQIFSAKDATYGTVTTLGLTRNSPFNSILRTNESPRYSAEVAANVMAVASLSMQNDAAQPLGTLPLPYVEAPTDADLDMYEERDLLLKSGISTLKVVVGMTQIDKLVTTYRLNAAGSPDTAYYNVETMATLMYLRYAWVAWWSSRHARSKLADDGADFGAGQAVVTPKTAKAEAVSWFRAMMDLGLVEDPAQFKRDLVAERNVTNRSRLDTILAPKLVGQLDIHASKISFLL